MSEQLPSTCKRHKWTVVSKRMAMRSSNMRVMHFHLQQKVKCEKCGTTTWRWA